VFRVWRPKRTCASAAYQTKLQLAAGMLTEVVQIDDPRRAATGGDGGIAGPAPTRSARGR
jgi:hypothetical protein